MGGGQIRARDMRQNDFIADMQLAKAACLGKIGQSFHLAVRQVASAVQRDRHGRIVRIAGRGVGMIDSPVGKTADHAIAGTLTLIVGGDKTLVEKARPVLDCMGTDFFYCGDLGMGEAMKLANNFLANTILSATSEALVMGVKAGLTLDTMMSVMRTTMAWNNQLGVSLPKKALADDFSLGFMVRLAEKDHRLAVEMAKSLGVDTPVGSAAFDVLKQASSNGLAGLDVSAVLRLREEQAGVKVRLSR